MKTRRSLGEKGQSVVRQRTGHPLKRESSRLQFDASHVFRFRGDLNNDTSPSQHTQSPSLPCPIAVWTTTAFCVVMPGRKSNVSTTSNGQEEVADSTPARQAKESKEKDGLSVEVFLNVPPFLYGSALLT